MVSVVLFIVLPGRDRDARQSVESIKFDMIESNLKTTAIILASNTLLYYPLLI